MSALARVLGGLDALSRVCGYVAAVLVVGVAALILTEVFCRTVLNMSLSFAWEYSAYFLAVSIFLAAAFTLRTRTGGHVRVMLLVFYAILGCVLEGMSSIVMTLPITLPLVQAAGFDKIWFGVFLVVVVEMARITPPVGFNLFVIQGMTGERIGRIALATLPFFLIMVGLALLITFVPEVVTFLPNTIRLNN